MDFAARPMEVFTHKFFTPISYPGAIQREELLARLFRAPPYGVVVVQAPAGHGKSTLLQQAKHHGEAQGAITAWLTLDEADNDMRRFAGHLQALVEGLGNDSPIAAGEEAGSPRATRRRLSDWAASRLAQFDRAVHLYFDEFQALNNRAVLAVFRELLERLPDNVTLFIGTRALPEIGLARLVVNNQALVLRADDLRFSETEAERFFGQAQDLGVSREELDAIYRQTEGWPAALQLFRLSLPSPSVRGALLDPATHRPRQLAEYLADNVLGLQPPRIQQFLRQTSVLTRLSAGLCDEVTGWQDSQSILLFLERSGLFLRCLDSELSWFKYHTLFSSFLADQTRGEEPALLDTVHRRAADWFYAHGMHEDAIHHAIAARNYVFAVEIMNVWADRLIVDANLATVERWSDALPLDQIALHPELAVKIAWALVFLRRHHKLRPLLSILEKASEKHIDSSVVRSMLAMVVDDVPLAFSIVDTMQLRDQQPEGFRAFELSAAANLSGYRAMSSGDFDAEREALQLARSFGTRGDAAFSGGYSFAVHGISLIMQGRLNDALTHYRAGLAEQHLDLDKSFAAASLVACYIYALYECDELDLAESMFLQFHDLITDAVLLDFLALGYLAMARIQDARGRANRADEVLAEAEQLAHNAGWPRLLRIVAWERVRRALLAGEVERAQAIASRIPTQAEFELPDGWMIFSESIEGDAIGRIRLDLHGGRHEAALARISTEIAAAQRQRRQYRLLKLVVLEALAHHGRGSDNLARRSLRRAVQLAAPESFVRIFMDEGASLLPLLRDEHASLMRDIAAGDQSLAPLQVFVSQLLSRSGQLVDADRTAPAQSGFQPLEPLTDRETEILVYLANGVSNKEMARRLFVSENTVKFHLKNIYSKLAVGSRLQAINAARQMALIR
ncbi:LuxR C-terminal-related transcriptional regulator [Solimonas terrae]|uniref:LuxR family transcriptional regulator n=1 Tax=Solimonas terrae TaxID=1396819 RepID=A0A6M2BPX1_9GAMM|nr:LuxR C-terminal-related transcriptional regulator [Solimonas terrae]NGY04508.1 LuxR family transcriptional regulator [Solimonas terrae]